MLNGKSLGVKDVKKHSHAAWIVEYAPGVIEARGYKGDKVTMTAKRETTGSAAELAVKVNRGKDMRADGEDVAMFAVEVRDAQGRVVPVTENDVTFRVSGAGKLIGTGNGDPTNQQPDKSDSRKAFCGLCMGIVQSTKNAGSITVEVSSPGLGSATATLPTKSVTLRPQVPVWEREAPSGSGITGLWRSAWCWKAATKCSRSSPALACGSLRQEGGSLNGTVEGNNISFVGGSDVPIPIEEGKVDGGRVTFKAGRNNYSGMVKGDRLELERSIHSLDRPNPSPVDPNGPAIGPAPDNSDPSISSSWRLPPTIPLVLQRVKQ